VPTGCRAAERSSPDADSVCRSVSSAGGEVRLEPFDVFTSGRMAQLTDPAGAEFAVWQAGDLPGALRMFQRALALNPNTPYPYFDLAVIYLRQHQLARAIGQFDAGLNLGLPEAHIPDLDLAVSELASENVARILNRRER